MAGASCQLSFLTQIQNARTEINTNFGRLVQNVNALQTRILTELERLEREYREEMENEEELRRLTQQLTHDAESSLASITKRIEQLVIEKSSKVLVLDWDIGTEQVLLNQFCKINVKKLLSDSCNETAHNFTPIPNTQPTIPEVSTLSYPYPELEVEETYNYDDDDVYNYSASSSSSSEQVLTLEEKYKKLGTPTDHSCSRGSGCGDMSDPRGVSIDDSTDEVYVADYDNHCIVVFDRDGSYLREFTHKRMVSPIGVCVSTSLDRVYISINGRNAVHCYKLDGTFIKEILSYSPSCITFDTPSGIAIGIASDGSERVYVCDRGNGRVPVFTKYLVYLTSLTTQLNGPRDVQVVGNEVAILHGGTYLVSFYSRGGLFLRSVVKQGNNKQKVGTPFFFCIDSDDNILITDTTHDCVKVYRKTGFHICNIGSLGESPGEFSEPAGIALFDDDSIVTVCDREDDQLQVFSL